MTPERITCLCPQCRTSYRVLAKAAGHHAQCRACGVTFRVVEKVSHPPTEDDILRWLREADEKDDAAVERWEDKAGEPTSDSSGEFQPASPAQQDASPIPAPTDARAIRTASSRHPSSAARS